MCLVCINIWKLKSISRSIVIPSLLVNMDCNIYFSNPGLWTVYLVVYNTEANLSLLLYKNWI